MSDIQSALSTPYAAGKKPPFHAVLSAQPARVEDDPERNLAIWIERYLRACGVIDPITRTRLVRRVLGAYGKGSPAHIGIGEAFVGDLQRRVDNVLLADCEDLQGKDRRSLCWGRVLLRNGTAMAACGCSPERYAVPPEQPADMPMQDLSAWSLRKSFRRFVRQRVVPISVMVVAAMIAAAYVSR